MVMMMMTMMMILTAGLMEQSIWRRSAGRSHIKAYLLHLHWYIRTCIVYVYMYNILYTYIQNMCKTHRMCTSYTHYQQGALTWKLISRQIHRICVTHGFRVDQCRKNVTCFHSAHPTRWAKSISGFRVCLCVCLCVRHHFKDDHYYCL